MQEDTFVFLHTPSGEKDVLMAIPSFSTTNQNALGILARFRPSAREFHKTALTISKEMETILNDTRKRVLEGILSREMGIKTLRSVAAGSLQRAHTMAAECQSIIRNATDIMHTGNGYNATDVLACTKELLDLTQEVMLEMTTGMRAVRSNWELYETAIESWLQDIQIKGLR